MSEQPRPRVSLISLGVGLAAAGVGAVIGSAAERAAIGGVLLGRERDGEDYTGLRLPGQLVTAEDGTALHVEVDELDEPVPVPAQAPAEPGERAHRKDRHERDRPDDPPLTVVFSHGYALSSDSWYFQRKALRGRYRMVFWDQRGHGHSGSGPAGSATIDQIGRDLGSVLDAVAPTGPLVLIGHSMGGMTVMSLAERRPELFAERVLGVGLVSTSAGGLGDIDLGMPRLGKVVYRVAPSAVKALSRTPGLVQATRRLGSDLESVLVRRYSFASPVPPELVRFTAAMIASTRLEVISDFMPAFSVHDKREALAALDGREVLVITGDGDLLIPTDHSAEIVQRVPGAEHVVVQRGGHLLMLEHPHVVTGHLAELIERSLRARHRPAPARWGLRPRRTVIPLHRRRGRRRRGDGVA